MASKIKTYWDEIKKEVMYFSAGKQGWEVTYGPVEYYVWDNKKNESKKRIKMELKFPFYNGFPYNERSEVRKDATTKLKVHKLAAQMSRNRKEYQGIFCRIDANKLLEITEGKTIDISLGDHIRQHYLTDDQAYSLFWRM